MEEVEEESSTSKKRKSAFYREKQEFVSKHGFITIVL